MALGKERRPVGGGHKRRIAEVEDTMVYIPILDTIQHLLNNDALVAEVKWTVLVICPVGCYKVINTIISR